MDNIRGKFTSCNFREILDLTEEQKQEFLDLQIAQAPVVSMVEKCECDVIANIFQRAIKRKGLTQEEVQNINKKMLKELRKKYKYWDNKLAEDMQAGNGIQG